MNALIAGQIDVMRTCPSPRQADPGAESLVLFENAGAAGCRCACASTRSRSPTSRVRQAFRLIVDRPADARAASPATAASPTTSTAPWIRPSCRLPQREQDIEKAKSLLKAAGQEKLTVDLPTNERAAGMNEMCKVFAQQAKAAGVTVNVKVLDSTTFNNGFLKWTFSPDFWGTRFYLPQVGQGRLRARRSTRRHWPPRGSKFASLYKQALARSDEGKRTEISTR